MEMTRLIPFTDISLVPDRLNPSPDYYCTWQTQLYACNNQGAQAQRDLLSERCLFGADFPFGWADFYPDARRDLLIVMDDSWDIPVGELQHWSSRKNYGTLLLDRGKFPSFAGENVENTDAMKNLSDAVKSKGWKGLGGWVCAEKPKMYRDVPDTDYWTGRLKAAHEAGWRYWKLDWGRDGTKAEFRRMLHALHQLHAPELVVEQAMVPEIIPESDVFRTYDVPAIMSIPMTMEKTAADLMFDARPGETALINCEDEVYLAAALGCTMGVMRHPMAGDLPNGQPDPSFPAGHRDLKHRMDEVTRAVRWHRIAPAFGVNGQDTHIDDRRLTDRWLVRDQASEIEAWWNYRDGDTIEKSGPARISRGLPLPEVCPDENGDVPYVIAAKYPSGAVSIGTLGRTRNRWYMPRCDVSVQAGGASTLGIFGDYRRLTVYSDAVSPDCRVLAQDLMGAAAVDITGAVVRGSGVLVIPGEVIRWVGTMAGHPGDCSDPGLVLSIQW